MDALLIILALPAALWALARIASSAWVVARASRARSAALYGAAGRTATDPIQAIRTADASAARAMREDYSLTGAILAGLGALAMLAGRTVAYGPWAVGLYSAGTLAIVTGVGLAILGAVLRLLARPLLDAEGSNRSAS